MKWITIALVAWSALAGCAKQTAFSSEVEALTAPATPRTFRSAEGDTMVSPAGWPECWLSSRLSAVQAALVAGERPNGTWGDFLYPKGERQQFRGILQNPAAEGDCILNWLGKNNHDEPWVAELLSSKYPGAIATLTCTADMTPDCHCVTGIPSNPGPGTPFGIGLCVDKVPTSGKSYELFNYRTPDPAIPIESAAGRCDVPQRNIEALYQREREAIMTRQNDGDLDTAGHRCRLDIEPFAPSPAEATWYGSDIRDWAVISCESNACRCFGTFAKSGTVATARGRWFENNICIICSDDGCRTADLHN